MRSDLLHVVCVIANPIRWESRIRLARRFAAHMLESGVSLTLVECAFGERAFELDDIEGIRHVGVRANGSALVWNKESLLNVGISRLPAEARYIATIDADIRFRSPTWAEDTVHALQHYDVVQPWSDAYDLGPRGEHLELHRSFGRQVQDNAVIVQGPNVGRVPYKFAHPGFAWAWRRELLDACGGLVETAGLGAADHHMAFALIGRVDDTIPGYLLDAYKRPLREWQRRAMRHASGNVGYVRGTIEHEFHGAKPKRAYVSRWQILKDHGFDPFVDLRRNTWGVVELAMGKPGLRRDVDRYFRSRDEDSNSFD